jgi:hypothetical protein
MDMNPKNHHNTTKVCSSFLETPNTKGNNKSFFFGVSRLMLGGYLIMLVTIHFNLETFSNLKTIILGSLKKIKSKNHQFMLFQKS